MSYPTYMQPINTKVLGITGYKRVVFAMFCGGMTFRDIAIETGLRPSVIRKIIVEVWAIDSYALAAEKELAELNRRHNLKQRANA